jgi:hypothetical protein
LGTISGSTSPNESVPKTATCYRFTVASPTAILRGLQVNNCNGRSMSVNGTVVTCSPNSGCSADVTFPRSADGYWYITFAASNTTSCTSAWWWW